MLIDLFEEPDAIIARQREVGQHDVRLGQERQGSRAVETAETVAPRMVNA